MTTPRYELDHVAIAAADTSEALAFLTGECSGTIMFGGEGPGFRPMQVWVGSPDGDGMSVELLEPHAVERNDFLARFVARHTAGPHHLTFKVPNLTEAIERVRGAGVHPVNIDMSDPGWMEAFLMPREAHGTVVQLAETNEPAHTRAELLAHVAENGPSMNPRWWGEPTPPAGPPARLRRVVLRTPVLADALGFFSGLLGGDIERETADRVELVWPSGSRLALEHRPDADPGVDRLEVAGLTAERTLLGARFVPA
ncbi:MAG: VOC family protein [Actinomycetota bacterium]